MEEIKRENRDKDCFLNNKDEPLETLEKELVFDKEDQVIDHNGAVDEILCHTI